MLLKTSWKIDRIPRTPSSVWFHTAAVVPAGGAEEEIVPGVGLLEESADTCASNPHLGASQHHQ